MSYETPREQPRDVNNRDTSGQAATKSSKLVSRNVGEEPSPTSESLRLTEQTNDDVCLISGNDEPNAGGVPFGDVGDVPMSIIGPRRDRSDSTLGRFVSRLVDVRPRVSQPVRSKKILHMSAETPHFRSVRRGVGKIALPDPEAAPRHAGERVKFGTGGHQGVFTLLGQDEYVQYERERRTAKVIWTTPDSASEFASAVLERSHDGTSRMSCTVTAAGVTQTVKPSELQWYLEENPTVGVVTLDSGSVTIGWRAAVAKLPGKTSRSECVMQARSITRALAKQLFETTGTDHVAKEGLDLLSDLDILTDQ